MDYYQTRVPIKYREHMLTVNVLLIATSSIGVLSYISGRTNESNASTLTATAGIVAGLSAAITAWQSENGADRKINRYTNAVQALKNHLLWWNGLSPVCSTWIFHTNLLQHFVY
jgi:hypothetical protein